MTPIQWRATDDTLSVEESDDLTATFGQCTLRVERMTRDEWWWMVMHPAMGTYERLDDIDGCDPLNMRNKADAMHAAEVVARVIEHMEAA